jgi:hypothetical protein
MLLPRVVACGLLACVTPALHAATFDLGKSGMLRIDIPRSWTTTGERLDNGGFDLRFQPADTEGPQICFTVIVPPDGQALDRTEASRLLREVAGQFASGSAATDAAVMEKSLSDGFAFYASIPTATSAGQSTDPDTWKSSTPCVMVLGGKVVISATIFADDTTAADFAKSLDLLWSARFVPCP